MLHTRDTHREREGRAATLGPDSNNAKLFGAAATRHSEVVQVANPNSTFRPGLESCEGFWRPYGELASLGSWMNVF
jgi:hypothetical protein